MSERIKDRIAKLIAMATDGRGNPHEAEAAMRMAQALMRKHGIELIEIARRTGRKPSFNWEIVLCPVNVNLPSLVIPMWFNYMTSGVCLFTDTLGRMKRDDDLGWCAEFCGEVQDVTYAAWLCGHLRDQARALSAEHKGTPMAKDMFRKAFAVQMCNRMHHIKRSSDEEIKKAEPGTSTALTVLRTDKLKARTERFGTQHYSEDPLDYLGGPGALEGALAAQRIGLNRPLTGD